MGYAIIILVIFMKKYFHYELKMGIMNILSIVLFIVPFVILFLCGYSINFKLNGLVFVGMLVYLLVHELFHALGYSLFAHNKKNIKIGITLEKGVFYAACQELISKRGIIISLLFPLIFLSIIPFPIALVFHINWLMLYSIMNFAGAIGDILMTVLILKMPSNIEYIDYDNSVGAYLVSDTDISSINSLGFRLGETGYFKDKEIDRSVKTFYVSSASKVILGLFLLFSIVMIILEFI